jgi:hypothetical protein
MLPPRQPGRIVQAKVGSMRPVNVAPNRVIQRAAASAAAPPPAPFVPPYDPATATFSVGRNSRPVRRSGRISSKRYKHKVLPFVRGRMIRATGFDKRGIKYWNGYRSTLRFTPATMAVMRRSRASCRIRKAGCTDRATSLDHKIDFASTQSGLPPRVYCDGAYHWSGILHEDAMADYNNLSNLQWSCTSCNSSKSGVKGLYSPPRFEEECPGPGECTL